MGMRSLSLVPGLILLLLSLASQCRAENIPSLGQATDLVKTDFGNFYLDPSNLIRLGIGLAGAGLFANTNMDQQIRDKYQEDLRSDGTDRIAKIAKVPGEGLVAVPLYIGAYGAGIFFRNPAMEEWAQRSFRATAVGIPAVFFLQNAIGSGRPPDGGSEWRPFQDNEGVSGHAFIGGIPFITAARMSDNPYAKGAFYGLSILPGLSRINDDYHYFSQAAMGWYLAYLSCRATQKTDKEREGKTDFAFVPAGNGFAVTFHRDF